MEENRMKKYYYMATYILAIIAILGFIYSIKTSSDTAEIAKSIQESSNDVSKTLYGMKDAFKQIQENFSVIARPIIKVTNRYLIRAGKLSCDNPPIGLKVNYKNGSNVTIQITDISFDVFYGEAELKPIQRIGTREIILAPAEITYYEHYDKINFKRYLGEPKDIDAPPHLRFVLTICYSSIGQQQKYMYRTEYDVKYDCRNADNAEFIKNSETDNAVNFTKINK